MWKPDDPFTFKPPIYGSDGSMTYQNGNMTHQLNLGKPTETQIDIGHMTHDMGSLGSHYKSGTMIFHSSPKESLTTHKSGNMWHRSDGKTYYRSGNMLHCSDNRTWYNVLSDADAERIIKLDC